ncbi:fimbrial protein [Vibrio metschnikovii]|uniref:fimbrial protein n=1 Tax=Vibrio metschnikovii TaxID=28172 RepID=UPI00164A39D9|nr:fimbrial protein [Vibrio metschnikovii]MBC5831673.1 type 1 fimbrial protein [Vibrio metschnikovii]
MRSLSSKKLAIYLLMGSINAHANILEISGKIKHPTCQVKVNNINQSPIITLPTINIGQLKNEGDSAGETTFEITLYDCLRSMTLEQHWDVRFSPWGIDKNRDLLIPGFIPTMSGTVEGIGLQILDSPSGTPLDNEFIGGMLIGYQAKNAIKIPPGESEGSHNFVVRYLSISNNPLPGKLTSYLQYAVTYF